jgi:hypothetical protein
MREFESGLKAPGAIYLQRTLSPLNLLPSDQPMKGGGRSPCLSLQSQIDDILSCERVERVRPKSPIEREDANREMSSASAACEKLDADGHFKANR